MRALLAGTVLALTGCSLIVGPDVPWDAGAGGGAAGGGGGGGAGGGGGSGGGSDAGCPGSPNPLLACAKVSLGTAPTASFGWAGATDTHFLAAWADGTSHRLEVRAVLPDGGVSSLVSQQTAAGPDAVAVSGEGPTWAVVWREGATDPLKCLSAGASGTVTVTSAVQTDRFAVAASADGGVAIVARAAAQGPMYFRVAATGCPTALDVAPIRPFSLYGVGVAHIPGTDTEGFRFTETGRMNAGVGAIDISKVDLDGGLTFAAYLPNEQPGDQAAALSGSRMLVTYSQTSAGPTYLYARALKTDLSGVEQLPAKVFATNPSWWATSACGSSCFATAWVTYDSPSHLQLTVRDATFSLSPIGAGTWDVACAVDGTVATVGVGAVGSTIGVLVTDPPNVDLYLCPRP